MAEFFAAVTRDRAFIAQQPVFVVAPPAEASSDGLPMRTPDRMAV